MARKKTLETSWRKWRQTSHIAIGIISQRHNVDATISHFFSEVVLGFDRNFIEIYFTISTSSNANESQNYSDINFIPRYIMDVEDEVNVFQCRHHQWRQMVYQTVRRQANCRWKLDDNIQWTKKTRR